MLSRIISWINIRRSDPGQDAARWRSYGDWPAAPIDAADYDLGGRLAPFHAAINSRGAQHNDA